MNNTKKNLRETIQFYLIDCKTITGKIIDVFIILLNLLVCIVFIAETYPISEKTKDILTKVEQISILFFIIEYFLRLYGSRNRIKYLYNITQGGNRREIYLMIMNAKLEEPSK